MSPARKGDLAIVIGHWHGGAILGQVVEVLSDPCGLLWLSCAQCGGDHEVRGSSNLVRWRHGDGWLPTSWLVPLPAVDAERERETERVIAT